MPAARRRIRPARSISRWLTISASAGTSFCVEMKNFEVLMERSPALSYAVGYGKIVAHSNAGYLKATAVLDKEGYRPNVGIILANQRNEVFWGKRINQHAWQFPQGGIKHGETPVQAMYRELEEEIGLQPDHGGGSGPPREWMRYDVPEKWLRRDQSSLGRGGYRGQKQ